MAWAAEGARFLWCLCEEHSLWHDPLRNRSPPEARFRTLGRLGEGAALTGDTAPRSWVLEDPAQC